MNKEEIEKELKELYELCGGVSCTVDQLSMDIQSIAGREKHQDLIEAIDQLKISKQAYSTDLNKV